MKLLSIFAVLFGMSAHAATIYNCDSDEVINDHIIYGSDISIEVSDDGVSAQVYNKVYSPGSVKQPTYLLTRNQNTQHLGASFDLSTQDLNISFTLTPKRSAGILRTSGMPLPGFRSSSTAFICEKQ